MPKPKIKEEDLILSPKADRYLEELEEHAEDSGDTQTVGTKRELAEIFNLYAKPGRNFRLGIIGLVAVIVAISTSLPGVMLLTQGDPMRVPNSIAASPPIAFIYKSAYLLGAFLDMLAPKEIFWMIYGPISWKAMVVFDVISVTLFWTIIAALICFPPKQIKKLFTRKTI